MGGPVMAATFEQTLPGVHGDVRVRCYDPGGGSGGSGPRPALVYLHGGGWKLFSLETHDRLMREYAARAQVLVIGVDYPLSPESRFPIAQDEVCAVLRQLTGDGAGLGIDPARLAVGGDSAGANLAVTSCLRLRDEGAEHLVRALVLNYGVFDRWLSPWAQSRFGGEGYMLSTGEMEDFWRCYLGEEQDADDPLVSPIRAELHDLPPALLVIPECDLLAEQSVLMAQRLRTAGVDVTSRLYAGATHSFLEAVCISQLADRALAESATWLRTMLDPCTR
jgi:acetyl esterase